VRTLGNRRKQLRQLGLRLSLAALEAYILGDTPAGARIDASFVFQFPTIFFAAFASMSAHVLTPPLGKRLCRPITFVTA
jgi:hypothetical protein